MGDRLRTAAVLSLSDPAGLNSGGAVRVRAMAGALSDVMDVRIVAPPTPPASGAEPDRPAGVRDELLDRLHEVKRRFVPMPTLFGAKNPAMSDELDSYAPDLVVAGVLSQAPYGRFAAKTFWLDFMDLWSDFGAREAASRTGLARVTARSQAKLLVHQEKRLCATADIVTAAGWADCEELRRRGVDATWLPTTCPDHLFQRRTHGPRTRTAGLLGNFSYWPNRAAYRKAVEEWLPALRAQGWQLLVAGAASDELGPPPEGVEILGEVADLSDYYGRIDMSLAPVDLGGGIKVKVLESFVHGIPVLGTRFAFEGFAPEIRELGVVWDDGDVPKLELDDLPDVDPTAEMFTIFRDSYLRDWVHSNVVSASP